MERAWVCRTIGSDLGKKKPHPQNPSKPFKNLMFSPNPLGQKKTSQHGLPESVKTIGNISQISKGPYLGGGDAAECTSWAHMVLHGDPCKTNGKMTFPVGAVCVAPWTTMIRVDANMVY